MGFIEQLKESFCDYSRYRSEIIAKDRLIINLQLGLKQKDERILTLNASEKVLRERDAQFTTKLKEQDALLQTPVDVFCKGKFEAIKLGYKDKIIMGKERIPCDMRELITPNSALVEMFKDTIAKSTNKATWYLNVTNAVNKEITWREEAVDNYYYPAYTLRTKLGDCDDFTYLQCSIEPEIANAFGFVIQNGKRTGHSFGVCVIDGKLFVCDAVFNRLVEYEPNKDYYINYIITKNQVYQVDGSVVFGDVLWA